MSNLNPDDTSHRVNATATDNGAKDPKQKAVRSLLSNGLVLIDLARDFIAGRYRDISNWSIAGAALSLAYVVSPVDLMPEIALGPLGLIDDAVVIAFAVRQIEKEIERYKAWKNNQPETDSTSRKGPPGKVVDV